MSVAPHAVVDRVASPPRRLSEALLVDMVCGFAAAPRLWAGVIRHDPGRRHAVRLLAHPLYDVWATGWTPGQGTDVHDHGSSIGALAVVDGSLVESLPRARRQRVLRAGDSIALPEGLVHNVWAPGPGVATSVHVYSPPLQTKASYDPETGTPDRTVGIDPAPIDLTTVRACRALHPAGAGRRALA